MKKHKLSIIIPFVGEYPQVLFTIQAAAQNFIGTKRVVDFEIIAVDNYCQQVFDQAVNIAKKICNHLESKNEEIEVGDVFAVQKRTPPTYENRSGEAIEASAKGNTWLKYIRFEDRLSHWQAKRAGVKESTGDILLFLDAHVIPSLDSIPWMFWNYINLELYKQGTLHLPLTYKILEWRRLIYKLHIENDYFYSYKFTPFRNRDEENPSRPFEVPCMSTCGMMISREIYESLGGWPDTLGIYGGGENFMNYALAVCGYKKFIFPEGTLFHHGDKRDYHYEGDDFIYNRMLAHYLFGGVELLNSFTSICRGRKEVLESLAKDALKSGEEQRKLIKAKQVISIEDWSKQWIENV